MKTIGNLIWLICGGLMIALEYFVSSLLLMVTIIGIPFGLLSLWPFGHEVVATPESGGCLSIVMNVVWIVIGGIWICLSHLLWGVLLCITIVGIPFGMQHFKLAGISLTPFGK